MIILGLNINVDEPIVMIPGHAWKTFEKTNIKSLIVGNW